MDDISDLEFQEACKLAVKHERFFPTPAAVRQYVEQARRSSERHSGKEELPQTPTRLSEKERQQNKQRAREIRENVAANSRIL